MLKRFAATFFLVLLMITASFAVMKGLEVADQTIVKVGENVTVPESATVKSAVSVGGSVTVLGKVMEDAVAVGGSVYLKDSAAVGGDAVAVGGNVVKDPNTTVKGETVEVAISSVAPLVSLFTKGGILKGMMLFSLLSFIGFLILATIIVALFTPQLGKTSGVLEAGFWNNLGVGLIVLLLIVPIIVILAISIIGIVLIPLWIILVALAGLFGYLAASHVVGKKTLISLKMTGKSMLAETLTGVILLCLVGLLPFVGCLIKAIAITCGLGGVYATRFGTR